MTLHATDFAATATVALAADTPALTATAKLAMEINDKHREVVTLGRTAKEIAAEIGGMLIEVKQKLAHGEFMPWVEVNCSFKEARARDYMRVAKAKRQRSVDFTRCESIAEVLALGKPKPSASEEPKPERRAATLDDLRKVERLRALRDDPACTEGEKAAAQRKLDEIEKEIGKVEPEDVDPHAALKKKREIELKACKVMDKLSTCLKPRVRAGVINALVKAYTDTPEKLDELLRELSN